MEKKNIVICCDGTKNAFDTDQITNVVHLYSCLVKNKNQIAYYSPGVGTLAPVTISSKLMKYWYMLKDAMSATSLEEDVKNAYLYLMSNYNEGDDIYFFGFSRGAYTVRMLHGILRLFGLLRKGNEGHFDYILNRYSNKKDKFHLGNKFKKRFSRKVNIKFIGLWDTVVAIGNPFSFYNAYPYSTRLELAEHVRHCISIDEKRKHYLVSPIDTEYSQSHKEVFFAGVHSDIGGSYPENESGLSKICLKYMLGEASEVGLLLDEEHVNRYVLGNGEGYVSPNYKQVIHNSRSLLFILADLIPRIRYQNIDFALYKRRKVNTNSTLHYSVVQKISDLSCKYKPKNLLDPHKMHVVKDKTIEFNRK